MARPVSRIIQSYKDYDDERANVGLFVTTLTAANLTAQTALIATLFGALSNATLGEDQKEEIVVSDTVVSSALPTDHYAQRETKWICRYHDATTNVKYKFELPCADLSFLLPHEDMADTTNTLFTSLKSAFEAVVRSPDDNNLCVFDSMQHVGRNL